MVTTQHQEIAAQLTTAASRGMITLGLDKTLWIYRFYCLVLDGYSLSIAADRLYSESKGAFDAKKHMRLQERVWHGVNDMTGSCEPVRKSNVKTECCGTDRIVYNHDADEYICLECGKLANIITVLNRKR